MVAQMVFGLFSLLILLLPSQLAIHFWPQFSYLGGIKVDYLSPTLYLTDVLIIFLIILIRPRIKFSSPIILFYLVILFNLLFSLAPWVSLYKFLRLNLYFLLFISLLKYQNVFQKIIRLFWPLMLNWVSLLAIFQFIYKSHLGGIWFWLGERPLDITHSTIAKISLGNFGQYLRPYSTLPHPNALAGFLVVSLVILFSFRKQLPPFHFLTTFILGLFALILTFSKGAFIALVISALLVDLPRIWTLLTVLVTFLYLYFGSISSYLDRWQQLPVLINIFKTHLLSGIGFGSFPVVAYLSQTSYRNLTLSFQPLHNIYLLLLGELGLILMLFLTTLIIKKYHILKQCLSPELDFIFFFVALSSLFDHYWITSVQNLLLLFIITAYFVTISNHGSINH